MAKPLSSQTKVYISYSHKDAEWKDRILKYLKPLESQGRLMLWEDSRLRPGVEWQKEIFEQRSEASAAILLISADFLSSDYINKDEVPHLLRRRNEDGLTLLPVLVSPCAWHEIDWLKRIHLYPKNAAPISMMTADKQEKVLFGLSEELLSILDGLGLGQNQKDEMRRKRRVKSPQPESGSPEIPGKRGSRFRVAFSFPSEKRRFVERAANILAERFGKDAILYDGFHEAEFATSDLGIHLQNLYFQDSDLIVLVLSTNYGVKGWVGFDWHGIAKMLTKADNRVMLCRFDHVVVPAFEPGAGFLELDDKTPEQFASLILERLATIEGRQPDFDVGRKTEQKQEQSQRKPAGEEPTDDDEALVSGPAGFYPEFRTVGVDGDVVDYLDVETEAERLADLIASRVTNLPLVVGLFANWGSGKSHFMGLLRMHMLNRANAARGKHGAADERWCKEIVPIVFNAWHYLDSNLWASLISEIFERLFEHLKPKGDALQQVQEKLWEAGGAMARAQEEVALMQAAVTKAAGELETAQRQAAQAQTVYAGMVDRLRELLPQFKEPVGVERIAELLGVAPEMAKLSELKEKNEELASVPGQVRELWQDIKAPQGRLYRIGWLLSAIMIGPLLLWVMQQVMPAFEQWLKNVGLLVKGALQSLIVLITALTPFVMKLQLRLREMRDLQRQAVEAQKRKETTPEVVKAKEELATQKALATQAEMKFAEAAARQRQLEKEAEELAPGRRVSRFIEERARSMDYRGQLGLVSLARRDFEELSNLFTGKEALEKKIKKLNEDAKRLEESGKEANRAEVGRLRKEAELLPELSSSVDRIVLFVDDLDRCQPERVVDVLQAVHLLLAFPLFAVIVGVDQRCLRTSLLKQFKGLVAETDKQFGKEHPATALDYLEKIFHVPFHLPGMDTDGFGKLIWNLSSPHLEQEEPIEKQEHTTTSVAREQKTTVTATDFPAPATPVAASPPTLAAYTPAPVLLGSVPLQDWERKALKRYHPLIRTPRAAIRLLNTYRLVRAGLTNEEWIRFRYNGSRPGESEIAMLLLAVAAGCPSIARDWFAALYRAGGDTWEIDPEDELRKDGRWLDLEAALARFDKQTDVSEEERNRRQSWLPELPMPQGNVKPVLHRWLPRIERFAF